MTTVKAAFGGWVPLVDLDKATPVPTGFVFQLSDELTPSHITNRFCKLVVLYHILDLQTLDAYDLVLADDLCRELVLVVSSAVGNLLMETSNLAPGFARFLLPFFFLASRLWAFASFFSSLAKNLGFP